MNLREFFVALGLDWDSAGFAEAMTATSLLQKAAGALVDGFKAIPAAIADAVMTTAEYGSQINDTSLRTGIAVDRLQELQYAFGLSGVSSEAMTGAIVRLGHTMSEAMGGSKEAGKGFNDLGVKVRGANGQIRNADETMLELIDRLGEIENPTERSAKGVAIFGKAYKELAPVFAAGGDELRSQIALFKRLDLAMSKDQVKAADDFGDSLDTVRRIFLAFKTDVGSVLIEALQPLVDGFIEWVAVNRQVIKSGLQNFAKGLIRIVKGVAAAVKFAVDNWKLFAIIIGTVLVAALVVANGGFLMLLTNVALNSAAMIAYGVLSVITAVKAAAAWALAAAPVVIITALFILLLLAIDDVRAALQGGDSVIGDFGKKWTDFLDDWLADDTGDGWLMTALKAVIWLITDITDRFPKAIAEWKQAFIDFFVKDIPKIFQRLVMEIPPFLRGPLGIIAAPTVGAWANGANALTGGAAGPEAGSALKAASMPQVNAPTFNAGGFVINALPGQDVEAIGDHVENRMNNWWNTEKSNALSGVEGN